MLNHIPSKIVTRIIFGYRADSKEYIAHLKQVGARIGENVVIFNSRDTLIDERAPYMITIGNNVQITRGVVILAHDYGWSTLKAVYGDVLGSIRETVIGDNTYIGMNTLILAGAHIGKNVVIGANSVVSGTIPDNCVAVGSPCRPIYSLEAYHEKRRKAQLDEAVSIVQNYMRSFGKPPERELLNEHFWLFEHDEQNLPQRFKDQMNLMPGSEELTWNNFRNHKAMFDSYEAFLKYALDRISRESDGKSDLP